MRAGRGPQFCPAFGVRMTRLPAARGRQGNAHGNTVVHARPPSAGKVRDGFQTTGMLCCPNARYGGVDKIISASE